VLSFLVVNAPEFSPNLISSEELLKLLRELRPFQPKRREVLYQRSEEASYGLLVLHGAVGVVSGEERFESTMGPLSCIGMRALELPDAPPESAAKPTFDEECAQLSASTYVPDFTATVLTEACLVVRIERERYLEAHLRKKHEGS